MLSKVLSARDAERARPVVFSTAVLKAPELEGRGPDSSGSDKGERALQDRIQQLEGGLAAVRREGFEAGRQEGEQRARAEIAPVLERLNAAVVEITGMRNDVRRRAEKDVVRLSLLIANRILHRELSVDSNALTALARVIFERLARAESYRVTVHPQFAAGVTAAVRANQSSRVQIETDPNCLPGTLIVHSDEGVIDASVDAQLEEISRGLTDRLANT